jgi:hypothetical protein
MDLFALRWRFDYNNRPTKCGMWGRTTTNPVDCAWSQPRDGLVRASIEGKNIETREILTFAECDGHAYRAFQWAATAAMPLLGGTAVLKSQLVGLKLLTTDSCLLVDQAGKLTVAPLSDDIKAINFQSY